MHNERKYMILDDFVFEKNLILNTFANGNYDIIKNQSNKHKQ